MTVCFTTTGAGVFGLALGVGESVGLGSGLDDGAAEGESVDDGGGQAWVGEGGSPFICNWLRLVWLGSRVAWVDGCSARLPLFEV